MTIEKLLAAGWMAITGVRVWTEPELKRRLGRAQLFAHFGVVERLRLVEQRSHTRVGGGAIGGTRLGQRASERWRPMNFTCRSHQLGQWKISARQ